MSEVERWNDPQAADVEISNWMKLLPDTDLVDLRPSESLGVLIQFCRNASDVEHVTWKHLHTLITFLAV